MKKITLQLLTLVMVTGMALGACAAPTPQTVIQTVEVPKIQTQVVKETQIQTVIQTQLVVPTTAPTVPPAAALPNCGTEPVVMTAYYQAEFPLFPKLTAEFTRQYPNVTWDLHSDGFTNLIAETPLVLASDNPPDLIRLATMVTFAKDGLLMNLDDYATAFGWDKWPVPQLNQLRVAADGSRGSGTLYAMGLNYQLTGVFYNKQLAAQIGMTAAPKTLAEFEDLLAKAKAAGIQPIVEWNATASGGGLAFPLQQLMMSLGPIGPVSDWVMEVPGATIDTPTNLIAAQHLEDWIKKGYFTPDTNALQYADAAAKFGKGEALFTFNGDWSNGVYTAAMGDNVGFFPFPPAVAGGGPAAMSAPATYGIAATAKHADCAAFWFNWVATDDVARQINVSTEGSSVGGPADATIPSVPAGSLTAETLAAGVEVGKAGNASDFIANSTSSIFAEGWTPELQKLFGGQQDAAGLLKAVQEEYLRELAQMP